MLTALDRDILAALRTWTVEGLREAGGALYQSQAWPEPLLSWQIVGVAITRDYVVRSRAFGLALRELHMRGLVAETRGSFMPGTFDFHGRAMEYREPDAEWAGPRWSITPAGAAELAAPDAATLDAATPDAPDAATLTPIERQFVAAFERLGGERRWPPIEDLRVALETSTRTAATIADRLIARRVLPQRPVRQRKT